jgi:hypothetical protein
MSADRPPGRQPALPARITTLMTVVRPSSPSTTRKGILEYAAGVRNGHSNAQLPSRASEDPAAFLYWPARLCRTITARLRRPVCSAARKRNGRSSHIVGALVEQPGWPRRSDRSTEHSRPACVPARRYSDRPGGRRYSDRPGGRSFFR